MNAELQLIEDTIRMALAEVGMGHVFHGVSPGTRWDPDRFTSHWTLSSAGTHERWAAREISAKRVGDRGPRCFECYLIRAAAYRDGLPEPEPCEAFGRWLIRDCGKPPDCEPAIYRGEP